MRTRLRRVAAAAAAAVGLTTLAAPAAADEPVQGPSDPAPPSAAERTIEAEIVELHLQARRDPAAFGHGAYEPVNEFRHRDDMATVARAWAQHTAASGTLEHNPWLAMQLMGALAWGENIARYGIAGVPQAERNAAAAAWKVQAWMDSDGHRENLMNPEFSEFGVGVAVADNGTVYSAVVFQKPEPPAQPVDIPQLVDTGHLCPDVPSRFVDVDRHAAAVECLAGMGVTVGSGDGRFNPDGLVTRGQMALFIDRTLTHLGHPLPDAGPAPFPDTPDGEAGQAVAQLAAAGIVSGRTDGTYGPREQVTRAQMAHFLIEALRHTGTVELHYRPAERWFYDTHPRDLFYTPIGLAADHGIAAGNGYGYYGPSEPVRRDHMALFLTRLAAVAAD